MSSPPLFMSKVVNSRSISKLEMLFAGSIAGFTLRGCLLSYISHYSFIYISLIYPNSYLPSTPI
jgi:hypothetical protein